MPRFAMRFNKTRGQPGRGTAEHAWRVFEGSKERLFKHVKINTPCWGERDGDEWNIVCEGVLTINRETSTAIIEASP